MHENSLTLMRDFINRFLDRSKPLKIADVGSFDVNGTYRPCFSCPNWGYTGFDIRPGANVDVVLASPEYWATPAEHLAAYDVVVSGQVMEHVKRLWKPGLRLIVVTHVQDPAAQHQLYRDIHAFCT